MVMSLRFVMFKNKIQLLQISFVFIVSHFYGLEKNSIINKKSKQAFEYVTAVKITTFNHMYLIVFYVKLSSNGYLLAVIQPSHYYELIFAANPLFQTGGQYREVM